MTHFLCTTYAAKLTRSDCAAKHKAAKRSRRHGTDITANGSSCATCEIGKAHARGEEPRVQLVKIRRKVEAAPMKRPRMTRYERAEVIRHRQSEARSPSDGFGSATGTQKRR